MTAAVMLLKVVTGLGCLMTLVFAMAMAYNIRLYAIRTYGNVIHEFGVRFGEPVCSVPQDAVRPHAPLP